MYRCEAASVEGFIQQLAVSYVAKGYWFYVTGRIPHHKVGHFVYYDPAEVALHIRTKLKVPARG